MKKSSTSAQKNQKYIALFLAVTMFLSIFVIYFSGINTNASEGEEPKVSGDTQLQMLSFSQLPGKKVQHEFNSIADGLAMSPEGPVSAQYIDFQRTKGTPFESALGAQQITQYLYGGDITKRFAADYFDGRHVELHQPAEQWYKDLKKLDDGSYSQTSIFLNPDENLTKQIGIMAANCSERKVLYDVMTEGNITKLVISADFESLNNETAMIMV